MIWGPTSVGEWWTPCNVELLMLGSGWSYNLVQGHDAFIIFFSFLFLRCLEDDMAVESNLQLPWAHHFPWTKTPIKMPCDAWLDHLTSLTCTEFPTRMCLCTRMQDQRNFKLEQSYCLQVCFLGTQRVYTRVLVHCTSLLLKWPHCWTTTFYPNPIIPKSRKCSF